MGYYVPRAAKPKHRQAFYLSEYHCQDCPYCGKQMQVQRPNPHHHKCCPTRDHIIPKSIGGRQTIVVCGACNNAKGDMHPVAWLRYAADMMPERVEAIRLVYLSVGVRLDSPVTVG